MVDARDLHQIEYRHHPTRDLSPVASSMSSESLRAWDSRIRMWVRHPHADRLSESVCYQLFPNGLAALAWRYWDQRTAERADGTRGRPLVSRVLAGQASVLTPDVAVALCQAGLTPDSIGPMPGEVLDGADLPTVSGDALNAVARATTPALDRDATHQDGLQAVVAAVLAEPLIPLAISVQDVLIQRPVREGPQCPLLWGLRQIAGPVLGSVGRDWSFSTFEPPLGETDPASLPGIVFRQVQDGAQAPPTRWRREAKVRPLAPGALGPASPYADWVEMAGWLVAKYRERGGDGLRQFITESCGSERSLHGRLELIYDSLRNTESPVLISREPRRHISLAAEWAPAADDTDQEAEGPEVRQAAQPQDEPTVIVPAIDSGQREPAVAVPAPSQETYPPTVPSRTTRSEHQAPRPGTPPALPVPDRSGQQADAGSIAQQTARHRSSAEVVAVSDLLRDLELVRDDTDKFESTLKRIAQARAQSITPNDRANSWEKIRHNEWYTHISERQVFHSSEIAGIFGMVVIPDLVGPDAPAVIAGIAQWAYTAPPPMIDGLLAAARKAGNDTWQDVMRILDSALAARWAAENLNQQQWDAGRVTWSANEMGRGDARKGLRRLLPGDNSKKWLH